MISGVLKKIIAMPYARKRLVGFCATQYVIREKANLNWNLLAGYRNRGMPWWRWQSPRERQHLKMIGIITTIMDTKCMI